MERSGIVLYSTGYSIELCVPYCTPVVQFAAEAFQNHVSWSVVCVLPHIICTMYTLIFSASILLAVSITSLFWTHHAHIRTWRLCFKTSLQDIMPCSTVEYYHHFRWPVASIFTGEDTSYLEDGGSSVSFYNVMHIFNIQNQKFNFSVLMSKTQLNSVTLPWCWVWESREVSTMVSCCL
jgi:hypothetical protein